MLEASEQDEEPPGKRRKISAQPTAPANIIILRVTSDKKHIIAVTGEDKCVRVFEIDENEQIAELSSR